MSILIDAETTFIVQGITGREAVNLTRECLDYGSKIVGGVTGNVTEFDGDLGLVIGAGGGSLTLFDAVRAHGGRPANYCEIGGNPSVRKTCGLAKLVLQKPGVEKIAVMMSIVSNTRVDIVARGVIKACLELGKDPGETIAIFRIPGAWEEEGFKILDRYGVEYCDRSVSMWEAAGRAVEKAKGLAKLVLSKPGVDKIAVMMSIVSNTRVDIVARGVIKAYLELGHDPAEKIAIFRIPGAWEDEGFKILEKYGVEYADRSVSMHEAARRAVEKIQGQAA